MDCRRIKKRRGVTAKVPLPYIILVVAGKRGKHHKTDKDTRLHSILTPQCNDKVRATEAW